MAVCNVEEVLLVFVLLVDAAAGDTVVDGCFVDLTERWIDCLLLLLAIGEEDGEEEVVVLVDNEAAVGVVLDVLCISSTVISLSLFFDLYCRVDLLDCLVVATISVVGLVLLSR